MTKRTFGFDTTTIATVKPLLEEGVYTGTMVGASVVGKENKQHINIVKETTWNAATKKFEETGEWVIEGNIYFGVALDDIRAIQQLQQDEPRVYGGRIRLNFFKLLDEQGNVSDKAYFLNADHIYGSWQHALGLDEINFCESVDFEFNDDIEVPEDLVEVPDVVAMLNALEYHRQMFNIVCESANSTPVRVCVAKQANYKTNEPENTIDCGRYSTKAGILKIEA